MKTYLIYKAFRKFFAILSHQIETFRCRIIFWGNHITYQNFRTNGIPLVSVAIGGTCVIGKNLSMNNGAKGNPIGSFNRCTLFVDKGATLIIGDYLGMSQSAIVCHTSITIGNHVKLGGGVCIYDTDFHSLDAKLRSQPSTDFINKAKKPVIIENNVFIGAHSLILKGVTIGENSIVGTGSVVTKSIPANEIWAGNPAKFIRNLQE
jgi:acetyltransferase-like isoleucine patch superfamily enzyme